MTASRTALSLLPYYLPKVTCKKVNAGIYCTSISTNLQGYFWKYAYRLRRYCTKINAQRIIDTPPLYFCSCLVSGITIFKSAGDAEPPWMVGKLSSSDVFAWAKTRVRQCTRMYTAGQAICKSAGERGIYGVARSAKYVHVLRWTQVWPVSNLFLLNTRGFRAATENSQRIISAKDGGGSIQ